MRHDRDALRRSDPRSRTHSWRLRDPSLRKEGARVEARRYGHSSSGASAVYAPARTFHGQRDSLRSAWEAEVRPTFRERSVRVTIRARLADRRSGLRHDHDDELRRRSVPRSHRDGSQPVRDGSPDERTRQPFDRPVRAVRRDGERPGRPDPDRDRSARVSPTSVPGRRRSGLGSGRYGLHSNRGRIEAELRERGHHELRRRGGVAGGSEGSPVGKSSHVSG